MWPYNDDESSWLEVKAAEKAASHSKGSPQLVVYDIDLSPEALAAHLAEGRRLQAEAFAGLLRAIGSAPGTVVARLFSRRAPAQAAG